jgi:hypothetical protein
VRFQVLTAVSMKMRALWDIAPRSLIGVDRYLRGAHCLYHLNDRRSMHPWTIGLLQDYTALYPRCSHLLTFHWLASHYEAYVHTLVSTCEIWGGRSCTGTYFSLSSWFSINIIPPWFSILIWLRDEQWACWWLQFGEIVSPHCHNI